MLSRFNRPTIQLVENDRVPPHLEFDAPEEVPEGFVEAPVRICLDEPIRRRYEDRDRDLVVEDWIVVAWAREVGDARTVRFVSTTTLRKDDTPASISLAFGKDIFRSLLEANLLDEEDGND